MKYIKCVSLFNKLYKISQCNWISKTFFAVFHGSVELALTEKQKRAACKAGEQVLHMKSRLLRLYMSHCTALLVSRAFLGLQRFLFLFY